MASTRYCKCGHASGYHKPGKAFEVDGTYLGSYHKECEMDSCNCKKFDEV